MARKFAGAANTQASPAVCGGTGGGPGGGGSWIGCPSNLTNPIWFTLLMSFRLDNIDWHLSASAPTRLIQPSAWQANGTVFASIFGVPFPLQWNLIFSITSPPCFANTNAHLNSPFIGDIQFCQLQEPYHTEPPLAYVSPPMPSETGNGRMLLIVVE